MITQQIFKLVNTATSEVLGKENILQEDLSNIVDIGDEIFNANAKDEYVKSLVNHIGKLVFVDRVYNGSAPSVLMDGWEYGSVCEKVTSELPEATENETWELEPGTSYDPNIFYKSKVSVKFFNKHTTFEIPISITDRQVKQSFSSAQQLNSFLSMLYNGVEKSMTVKIDALIMRTINHMMAETIYSEYPNGSYGASSGVKVINLLKLYNNRFGTKLTRNKALTDEEFLKFASLQIRLYVKRIAKISTLFNVGNKERFTTSDYLHLVLLSDFSEASSVYLQADTYHKELVALKNYESVPYWQGTGKTYDLDDISAINVKTASGATVAIKGVIGTMFDREALGVTNENRRTTTNYNPKAEFYNNWAKFDCSYFNDLNENCLVFIIADAEE